MPSLRSFSSAPIILIMVYCAVATAAGDDTVAFSGTFSGTAVVSPGSGTRCSDQIVNITALGTLDPFVHFTTVQSHCIAPPLPMSTQDESTLFFAGATLEGLYHAGITGPPVDVALGQGIALIHVTSWRHTATFHH